MGRRVDQVPENFTRENFRAWNDRSRANLGRDTLDLVQLHCPPTAVYDRDEVFDALDEMVSEKRIAAYGVSVETVAEAQRRAKKRLPRSALRWVIDQPQLSVVIPGARTAEQARGNAAVADLAPLSEDVHAEVRTVYDELIAPHVQHRW